MRKEVGSVTEQERDEIQALFEHRNGLAELAKILTADNTELYERMIKDMGETAARFSAWWDRMSNQYNWESAPDGNWEIDFDNCTIFLVTPE